MVMNTTQPLISIIMPVYNPGPYFRLAVLSIVNQIYERWELLIWDDGTTDGSFETIADIVDARIRIMRDGNNRGLAVRLNQLIEIAKGHFIARMDADDFSYPQRLAKQVEYLQKNPAVDLVATRAITINSSNRFHGTYPFRETHQEICQHPWLGFYLPHPTWMAKATWFKKFQYKVPAPYLCEDQELLLRSYQSSTFAVVPEVLFAYRVRDKIAIRKQFLTRWALFKTFAVTFLRRRRWGAVLLVCVALIGRLMRDARQRIYPSQSDVHSQMAVYQSAWEQELLKISTLTNRDIFSI